MRSMASWGALAVVGFVSVGLPAAAQLEDWPVGEERETDPGHYVQVLANKDGWLTYRTVNANEERCSTVKAEPGRSVHPPIRSLSAFGRQNHLRLRSSYSRPMDVGWVIVGGDSGDAEWRVSGERFMKPQTGRNEDLSVDGEIVEFRYEAMRYPRLSTGYYVREGRFDMTGLRAAVESHKALCLSPHS